jgi:hypothetical protein
MKGTGMSQPAARPFKPYIYKGGDVEPAAVTEARERYRAREAERERWRAQVNARLDALAAGRDPDRCGCCGRFIAAAGHGEACGE